MSQPLAEVLHAALTHPDTLGPSSVALRRAALGPRPHDEPRGELIRGTLAALLYSRPDLVPEPLLDPGAELLCAEAPSEEVLRYWCRLWESLAATDAAPRAWALLSQVLLDERLAGTTRGRLVPVVGAFVQWRADLVGLDAVLALPEPPPLPAPLSALLAPGVDRYP